MSFQGSGSNIVCPRALSFIWFRLLELLGTIVPFSGAPIPFTSLFLTLQPSSLLMAGVFGEEKYWNRGSPEGIDAWVPKVSSFLSCQASIPCFLYSSFPFLLSTSGS